MEIELCLCRRWKSARCQACRATVGWFQSEIQRLVVAGASKVSYLEDVSVGELLLEAFIS